MHKSVILGVVVVRYVLLPIIGVLIVQGAHYLGLITSEPLYQFVLLLQYVVPPAMNLGSFVLPESEKYYKNTHHTVFLIDFTFSRRYNNSTIWVRRM